VVQSLPYDFAASVEAFGQTSFHKALLTSEQFSIDGAKMLSGFTSGALPGDTAWAIRGELSRPFGVPVGTGGITLMPYLFAAAGERILLSATALEIDSVHATNAGLGMRFSPTP
jgi:hemolysin activation/secretion protein